MTETAMTETAMTETADYDDADGSIPDRPGPARATETTGDLRRRLARPSDGH